MSDVRREIAAVAQQLAADCARTVLVDSTVLACAVHTWNDEKRHRDGDE